MVTPILLSRRADTGGIDLNFTVQEFVYTSKRETPEGSSRRRRLFLDCVAYGDYFRPFIIGVATGMFVSDPTHTDYRNLFHIVTF